MKTLCRYCVKKPVTVLMAVLIIVVFGIFSLTRMSLALFPNLNLPYAVIVTTYVGANPEEVEKDVSIPIEQQMVTLTNYHSLTSTSNEHYSMIMIEFEDNTNMDNAFLEMREAVDSLTFPDGVGKPRIMRITADMMPIVSVSIAKKYEEGTTNEEALIKTTQWVQNELESELVKIDGVAQISYTGTADVVLDVNFDTDKLTTYNTSSDKILKIIEDTNKTSGLIGITTDSDGLKMLYIGDPTKTIEELKELPINYVGGEVIRIKDVLIDEGTVDDKGEVIKPISFKNNNTQSYNKIDSGKGPLAGITVSFQQDSSAELTTVVKNIKKAFNKVIDENPDVQIIYILDQGEYVETSIGTVIDNLVQGALLAVIILLIFLVSIKPTLIVAISIPVSIIATFAAMYFAGINLNIVSMGGLALGIGMLVDNSVVVIENIFRMIKNGKSKTEAAIHGAAEVAGAITASTLTTLAVFIPIMFLKGLAGSIFKEMALTVCFSLGCSLIIALTVVPSAAAKFLTDKEDEVKETKLKKLDEKINSNKKLGYTVTGLVIALIATSVVLVFALVVKLAVFYSILIGLVVAAFMIVALISSRGKIENKEGKITKGYEKTIRWSINHKTIVLVASVLLLVVSGFLALTRGFALIPATDEGSISGSVVLNSDLSSKYIYNFADECTEAIMASTDDIDIIQTRVGSTSLMSTILGQSGSGSTVNFTVALKDDRKDSTKKNRQKIEEAVNAYIEEECNTDDIVEVDFSEASSMTSMLGTSGTMIYVEGSNLYELEAVANDLVKVLEDVEGVEKPNNGVTQGDDTVKITVNKDEAVKLGLYAIDYSNAVNLLYKGLGYDISTAGQEVLKVNIDGVMYELTSSASADISNFKMPKELFLNSIAVFENDLYTKLDEYTGSVYQMNPKLAALINKDEYISALIAMGLTPEQAQAQIQADLEALMNGTERLIIINKNLVYNGKDLKEEDRATYTLGANESWVTDEIKAYIYDPVHNSTKIEYQTGFTTISRNGKNRYLLVTAELSDGYNATKVGSKVTSAVDKYLKSDDFKPYQNTVKVYEEGENEQIMDVVKQLVICGIVAILLVYMIMCIQFQSLKYPLIIMGTIPLAFTGGFLLLFICGMELSMVALIGLVVLVGVVVNNGIVIVDYMNQLVEQGMHVKEAAVLAGKTRLRPIFMTALTTIFALLTMALGIGESAEIMQPLAIAAIGGLTYATVLTLLVIPSLYVMMNRKKIKKEENNDTTLESEDNGEVATN
ncbi:MAG: efflux RND transporter permease subunit [Acholeplasmatales bacterium]|nr:efflux RND transporter permease subunit [Acholeplasmatales bacterium]